MLGDKLKDLRKKEHLTQLMLAEKCGVSKNAIWNYENNKRVPTVEILEKLATALNVSVAYLLNKDDEKDNNKNILDDPTVTIALHNDDGIDSELPEEAKKEIANFIEYVKNKYKK